MRPGDGRNQWREVRLPQVEARAYEEIRRFERRFGPIRTPCIPVDRFVEDLWGLRYVHCDPELFGFPAEVQGGLRTDLRKVIISDAVTHRGQMNMVKLHEGAHWVLHTSSACRVSSDQMEGAGTEIPSFFCRGEVCYRDGRLEEPWMHREAEFFAACMLLPREHFKLRGERRIHQAWREEWHGHPFPGPAWFRLVGERAIPGVVERAVHLLHEQHEGEASKTVIRIRLAEVGLAPAYSREHPVRDGFTRVGGLTHIRELLPDALLKLDAPYVVHTTGVVAGTEDATREGLLR